MGEYAEMMLDGTCCASCGEYLDQEPDGYPVYCAGCGPDFEDVEARKPAPKTIPCSHPGCNRMFATKAAQAQHTRDKHQAR